MESPHSEASKLLEAALEQMDGIIQGAKYEIPNFAEFSSGQNGGGGGGGGPGGRRGAASPSVAANAPTSVSGALRTLRVAIMNAKNEDLYRPQPHDVVDEDTVSFLSRFLSRWLANNPQHQGNGNGSPEKWNGGFDMQDRLVQAEVEKDALHNKVGSLSEQLARQKARLADTEQLLAAKKELLRKTEMALDRERQTRTKLESQQQSGGHYSEMAHLRSRCSALEMENQELRKICSPRTPKYIPISPSPRPKQQQQQFSSPASCTANEDDSSCSCSSPEEAKSRGVVGFTGRDENISAAAEEASVSTELDISLASNSSSRPPRGFKKIFGKIKRSNSGGHLEDNKRSSTPEFRRGGFRATAGGRIAASAGGGGGWSAVASATAAADRDVNNRKPISEWSVDMICVWLEAMGLDAYCQEVRRTIGTGEQLAKMTFNDLESKLNVKHVLHRKKLFLALAARLQQQQQQTSAGEGFDEEGGLDYQWVLRWLDDIGLPQYKDVFLEARVDGRVLNVLTVDDLYFQLKVTNQLHHSSIRRSIQVLRQQRFESCCLRRRAAPGETLDAANVALWSNHRVMEWLKQVDLSEYAPNLRGSGVHGALLVHEPKFNDKLLAALLSIPAAKTLLRRHLSIHFKELVGRGVIHEKRSVEQESGYVALTPTAKAKCRQAGQFTLKRKKSKSHFDYGDLVCPFVESPAK